MVNEKWICQVWKRAEENYYTWVEVRIMMYAAYMSYPVPPSYSEWKTTFDDYAFLHGIAIARFENAD